jgi:hypothetical protein
VEVSCGDTFAMSTVPNPGCSWTHASPSAVHDEDVVWPWLATLPRNSKFTGDVREIVRKFALFCDAGAAGDTDDSGSGSGSDSEDEC